MMKVLHPGSKKSSRSEKRKVGKDLKRVLLRTRGVQGVKCVWNGTWPHPIAVQSPRQVQLFSTPWTAAHQALLSFTVSPSLLKLMSTELVMPSIAKSEFKPHMHRKTKTNKHSPRGESSNQNLSTIATEA